MKAPIRVLLVMRNVDDARLLVAALAGSVLPRFTILHVERLDAAVARLDREPFDLVLADLSEPEDRSLDVVRRLRGEAPDAPLIGLIAAGDGPFGLDAVEAGAQDALVKGATNVELLVRAMRYAVERQRLLAELRALSLTDELTGLYNRRGFLTVGAHQLRTAARAGRAVSVFFLDVDGMKAINDTFGHREGDRALSDVAEALRRTFREADTIARIGGDEFAVLAVTDDEGAPAAPIERLQQGLAALRDRGYRLSVSAGMIRARPGEARAVEPLLAAADARMYADKTARRGA